MPRPRGVQCTASPQALALCCDATLCSLVTSAGMPHRRAVHTAGMATLAAEGRKHTTYSEPRRAFVRSSVSALFGHPSPCGPAAWARKWSGMLSVAVQHAIGGTALGAPWLLPGRRSGKNRPWIKSWRWRSRSAPAACQCAEEGAHGATVDKVLFGLEEKQGPHSPNFAKEKQSFPGAGCRDGKSQLSMTPCHLQLHVSEHPSLYRWVVRTPNRPAVATCCDRMLSRNHWNVKPGLTIAIGTNVEFTLTITLHNL